MIGVLDYLYTRGRCRCVRPVVRLVDKTAYDVVVRPLQCSGIATTCAYSTTRSPCHVGQWLADLCVN